MDDPIAAIAAVRTQLHHWDEPYRAALDAVCRAASRAHAAEAAARRLEDSRGPAGCAQCDQLREECDGLRSHLAEVERQRTRALEALEQRKIIERAKGIVMEQCGLSENDAYHAMRRTAMYHGRQLWDIAAAVVARPSGAHELLASRGRAGKLAADG